MAEYMDRDKAFDAVDKRIDELKSDKQFNIVKEIDISGVKKHILNVPTADVVERSEYDKMVKYLKAQIENKENNLRWNRLQRKIDKAYKEMEDLFKTSLEECPLSEVAFRCGLSYAMDILVHDVGVGEK